MRDEIVRQLNESARLKQALAASHADTIAGMARAMIDAVAAGHRIYFAGNGGSAADAQHLVGELVGRFRRERAAIPAVALTTNTSVLTAVGNDYGFDRVFARQVEALVERGDVFVGITTSGNSPNVVAAAQEAAERGAVILGFTGRHGGKLAEHAHLCLTVDSTETWRIQEAHITAGHIICDLVEAAVVKGLGAST